MVVLVKKKMGCIPIVMLAPQIFLYIVGNYARSSNSQDCATNFWGQNGMEEEA